MNATETLVVFADLSQRISSIVEENAMYNDDLDIDLE